MRALMIAIALFLGLDVVTADTPTTTDELTKAVALMARVGRCGSPTFSPDGKTLAFVCDMSGTPRIGRPPTEGRWPTLVTALDDPVAFDGAFSLDFEGFGANSDFSVTANTASAVPEPGTMLLLGTGLLGFVARIRRKLTVAAQSLI